MSDLSQKGPAPPAGQGSEFKPAWAGSWFLFLGALLGPAIVAFDRDPHHRVWLWAILTLVMVCLILHRASLSYSLDGENLTAHSWWGLGQKVSLRLRNLARAEVHYSFSSRLVGLGHLFLASSDPNEKSLVLVAQRKPEELADRLLALAQALMASPRPAADPKSSTPGEAA